MTTVSEAAALIAAEMQPWPTAIEPLESVVGRVLAADVVAERDIPAFDRVTMDGIAIDGAAWQAGTRVFRIEGVQAAGVPAMKIETADQCIRVMTGAVMPAGCDTVIPVERLVVENDHAKVEASAQVQPGQFVHCRGSDRAAGDTVLRTGTRIGAPEMAVLASVGQANVTVSRVPRIAVISTGDELVGVDEPVAAHQIRSSNDRAIAAALQTHHCAAVTRRTLRDKPAALLAELEALHADHDALILSGGVSMGDFDFVPGALKHLGARLVFHRIDQKPGRPMWFGMSGADKPIFALPGNPVSTLVCMTRYVVPALRTALGLQTRREFARLTDTLTNGPRGWTWFVPVTVESQPDGGAVAQAHGINTSGDFSSLAGTDGIAELGTEEADRRAGTVVEVFRW